MAAIMKKFALLLENLNSCGFLKALGEFWARILHKFELNLA